MQSDGWKNMKYQIWTNSVLHRVKIKSLFGWKWAKEWTGSPDGGHPTIKSFNSLDSAKGYIQGLKDKVEENNPRWEMIEEC